MEFKFYVIAGRETSVEARTAKQAAQLAAFKIWQKSSPESCPTNHTQIRVTEPGPGEDDNAPGCYGVTYVAPGETSSYTLATVLKMVF